MTALPAWASDLACETCCDVCQRPILVTLRAILQAQPVGCACGYQFVPATLPGMPEIADLLATLERANGDGRAMRTTCGQLARMA